MLIQIFFFKEASERDIIIMTEEIVHAQSLVWALINNKYTKKWPQWEKRS